ncbi:MAG: hypothetical protein ACI9WU_003097 [Myxococcota bacterium]
MGGEAVGIFEGSHLTEIHWNCENTTQPASQEEDDMKIHAFKTLAALFVPLTAVADDEPGNCGEDKSKEARTGKHLEVTCSGDDASYWDCKPKATFAEVTGQCDPDRLEYDDDTACLIPEQGLEGKLTAAHAELFTDLANTLDQKWNKCRMGPQYPLQTGLQGLGLMRDPANAPVIERLLGTPEVLKELGAMFKNLAVEAMWRINAKSDASIAALVAALPSGRSVLGFRYMTLQALAHWESDAAIPFCMKNVNQQHADSASSCALHLGQRKYKAAGKLLRRNIERLENDGKVALGLLGDQKAKELLRELMEKGGNHLVPSGVALMNLGDSKAWKVIKERMDSNSGWFRNNVLHLAWANPKAAKPIIKWLKKKEKPSRSWYALSWATRPPSRRSSVCRTTEKKIFEGSSCGESAPSLEFGTTRAGGASCPAPS